MSVDTFVFLNRTNLPTLSEWNIALELEGIALRLEDVDDLGTFSGFLPAKLNDRDAGFEWFFGPIEEVCGDIPGDIGNRTHAADFATHSDLTELASAQYAAAILARLAGGVVYDAESGEFFSVGDLLEMANETLRQS